MKNGPARFDVYLDRMDKLLVEAAAQPDSALWLYQNNVRTPLFMLEGLAKLYSGLHNKNRFRKIKAQVKVLEDALGAVDYYDGFAKQFIEDKKVPAAAIKAVQAKTIEKTQLLNTVLNKKNWIGAGADRVEKIRAKLGNADWLNDKEEIKAIECLYLRSIDKINAFARSYESGFTALETQVHELRRKLRWLSIYPAALQGCIQLTTDASNDKNVVKYLTPEIVNSPFNQMPPAGGNRYLLIFDKDHFLALSWMIAELGKLKDQGLRTLVLNEVGTTSATDDQYEAAILRQASEICRTYFAEKNLDKLVLGVVKNNT